MTTHRRLAQYRHRKSRATQRLYRVADWDQPHRWWSGEQLESRLALAPVPVVGITSSATPMIGESYAFQVSFDNQATGAPSTGYGPYVDLFLDTTGADGVSPGSAEPTDYDGFGFQSASFLGASITPIAVTIGAGGTYTHPIARTNTGAAVTGTAPAGFVAGDTLYVLELPFGSFVDEQTIALIDVNATVSAEADLSSPLRIASRGGFRYGSDALDNPTTDPSILGAVASTTTDPQLIRLTKTYLGPEDETATGPNYPRRYTLHADIASGQTITNLRLTDLLPNNLAFLSVISSSPAGAVIEQTPTIGAAANSPNNDLVVRFPSVLGTTATSDASVTFEFFVPEFDANANRIISATSGDDVPSINDGRASGTWTPTDPSDTAVPVNIVDQTSLLDNHTLTDKSIAIQKSVTVLNDLGATGPTPGDTLEYTLNFQISDYFTFGDLIVEDIFSDGQRLNGSPSGPFPGPFTLTVTDRNGTVSGNFTPSLTSGATNLHVDLTEIGNDTNPATDGSTKLTFDVSRALVDLGASDGILQGGRAISPDAGPATGTITYRTVIQQSFTDTYPSGEPIVNQGDLLNNNTLITGSVRNNSAIATTVGTESDDSAAEVEILSGSLLKTIYAINGVNGTNNTTVDGDTGLTIGPSYSSSLEVRPGDVVTYRLRYTMPTSDVEGFSIVDYLPLPVYDATELSSIFDTTISGTAPVAGSVKYGPDHTFSRPSAVTPPVVHPTLLVSGSANSLTFDFGDYDQPPPESAAVVDLMFSVTISDEPMADGLLLTNQATAFHGTTNAGTIELNDIVQITLAQPDLNIRKGVVSSTNTSAQYSSTRAPSGITFEQPGLSTSTSFTGGTISSANLGTTLNANVSRVDAGDLVKFAIVLENTGNSTAGAFDVRFRDTLPTGFAIPASGLNLEIFDGTGASVPFSSLGSGLFDASGGIELSDPGATAATTSGSPPVTINGGALDGALASAGRNLIVVTYDLEVIGGVAPGQTANLLNTATLFHFAGTESGPDYTNPTDRTDPAQVTIANPGVAKSIVSTGINSVNNNNTQVVIGETVTYDLVITVPEGTMPSAQIVDTLNNGLALVDVVSVTSSAALTIQNAIGTGTNPANVTVANTGRLLTFNFGNVTNSDRDNATSETITIRYRAVALNVAGNQSSPTTNLTNSAALSWTGGNVAAVSAPTVRVLEPLLDAVKSVSPSSADAGDTVTFTVTVSHAATSNTDAFDVSLSDVVPTGLSYVANSWSHTGGAAPATTDDTAGTLTASWASFPLGSTSTFQFQAVVSGGIQAGQSVTNTATATWTSLSGPTSSDLSVHNTNSRERTGAGGVNDYTDNGTATVQVLVPTTKTLVSTSETSTTGSQVAIGEVVRYRLSTQIPEGSAPTFRLIDQLPAGLQFLDDGTTRYALVANGGGITSSTLGTTGQVTGASGAITPTTSLPGASISGGPFSAGTDPIFAFGNLTNSDNDVDGEFIVLEFNALVLNAATNIAGASLSNTYTVEVNGAQVGTPSAALNVTIVEPSITNVNKVATGTAASGVDAGEQVTFRVTYTNSSAANSTTAFEARLQDTLPANLSGLQNVRVFRNSTQILTGFTNASTTSTLDVTLTQVAPGDVIQIDYDATVSTALTPGSTVTNTAQLTYTSLPGSSGTTSNPTGSPTPGAAGAGTGERTGSGGVNSYTDSDGATITAWAHSLSGLVYRDNNNNGLADDGVGTGISGVTIQLTGTDHLGNPVSVSLQTAADGTYSFTGLRAGSYQLVETQPVGFFNGRDTLGTPTLSATNTNRYNDTLGTLVIPVGSSTVAATGNNFGELAPASLSGVVYVDSNANGLFNAETGLVGVPISLSGTDDLGNTVSLTTTTGAGGAYSFTNLRPGTYSVTETSQPSGYFDGQETRGNVTAIAGTGGGPDQITGITVVAGNNTANNNFGELAVAAIRGRVFSDIANDGTLNGTDGGLANVSLQLTGTDLYGNVVTSTTTTLADGTYAFTALPPGTYTVIQPTQPSGYFDGREARESILIPNSNSSDVIGSITLTVGNDSINNNFAEVPMVDPVGYVYVDVNQNGVRDVGEPGIAGVQITLTGIGFDIFGNPITPQTAFTDANGFYQFANLPPARYTITETQPNGLQDAQEQNGTPAAAIVLNDQFVDINLFNQPLGGDYNFGEISPRGSLTGFVYVDQNNNGNRDANEMALAGVLVTVVDENNPNNTATVTTNEQGQFNFVKMFPGTYRLIQTQPVNFIDGRVTSGTLGGTAGTNVITGINVGVNQTGVNYRFGELGVDPRRISKQMFLSSSRPWMDFTGQPGGAVAAVSVPLADPAGYVYVDRNQNGLRDSGEEGIAGVTVRLEGQTNTGHAISGEVTTDRFGFYQFAFLPPGTYSLFETQPDGYLDGAEQVGTLGGRAGQDQFTDIVLEEGDVGLEYNFGELLKPEPTILGDVNRDGLFNSTDLLLVFQVNEYEDRIENNSTYDEGDWDGDGDFTTSDLILALQSGRYEK